MKTLLTMRSILVFAAFATVSSQALAARYMVVFKNKDVFRQTHAQLMLQQMPLSKVRVLDGNVVKRPFAQAQVEVQDSLQSINTLVVVANDESSVEALKQSGAVEFVEKEVFFPAPKPVNGFVRTQAWDYSLNYSVSQNAMATNGQVGTATPYGISMVRAPGAWATAHYGEGARVLVLDTGIDKDHPALKDNFEKGQDFVGDNNQPYEFADHVGHGTHVSGTIAAAFGADGFVGVAPKAKILMGRVCSEQGCSNIGVTQGIAWGIQEKVDVISLSLGGPFGTLTEKRAVEAAEHAGVIIVAATGNDGAAKVSFPAAFDSVIAVGAVDANAAKATFSNWGPELDVVAPGVAVLSSVPVGSGRASLVQVGMNSLESVNSASFVGSPDVRDPMTNNLVFAGLGKPEDFARTQVTGKFAFLQRGEIAFGDKVKNAIAAGAAGVVIFNNAPGLVQGALTQDGSIVAIPVVIIEQTVGEQLYQALAKGAKVRASIQTLATSYSAFDGTSMACPHVTGVVALIRATKKAITPEQVRALLGSTAQALTPNDQNQMGSGLVNAEAAVQAIR